MDYVVKLSIVDSVCFNITICQGLLCRDSGFHLVLELLCAMVMSWFPVEVSLMMCQWLFSTSYRNRGLHYNSTWREASFL